jgi:hypothetical protein
LSLLRETDGSSLHHHQLDTWRWACLKLTPSTPAADTVVRRPASTSVKTSTRCKSCLLICTQPNLSPPTLISGWGSDTLALQSYDIIAALAHIW